MGAVVYFDTLAYANKLKEAGVPDKQAEIQAEVLTEIFSDRVATKQDTREIEVTIKGLEARIDSLEARIDSLEAKIDGLEAKMESRFAQIENKFVEFKIEIIKWVIGLSIGQVVLILSVLKFFLH